MKLKLNKPFIMIYLNEEDLSLYRYKPKWNSFWISINNKDNRRAVQIATAKSDLIQELLGREEILYED